MTIVRREHRAHFTIPANAIFLDQRVSSEAKGVLGYLLSRPNKWSVRLEQVGRTLNVGRRKLQRIFRELVGAGYVTREQRRVAGAQKRQPQAATAFKQRGGKLIQWHGWADGATVPGFTAEYYEKVLDPMGHGRVQDVQDFYRLFMMPGVGHCGTGPGPDDIGGENQTPVSHDPQQDVVSALEAWRENGVAPQMLIASKLNVANTPSSGIAMQRPICPYPSEVIYNGSGNTNAATSFHCGPSHLNTADDDQGNDDHGQNDQEH